jgi:hypothetical protein
MAVRATGQALAATWRKIMSPRVKPVTAAAVEVAAAERLASVPRQ